MIVSSILPDEGETELTSGLAFLDSSLRSLFVLSKMQLKWLCGETSKKRKQTSNIYIFIMFILYLDNESTQIVRGCIKSHWQIEVME